MDSLDRNQDKQSHIRNFAIIAHIDHGKSTLADRLLEMTHTIAMRDMQAQYLDSNPIERERGITIKLAPVRMLYKDYVLNLIDTPGHVDFGYEVSRSLAACEGAILVVDATQGVQAQTLANLHQARQHKLVVIPVINKIDMPMARIEETRRELVDLGFLKEEILEISAKTGKHVDQVLEAVVDRIPAPVGNPAGPVRGLVFSSQYDAHKGVVVFVRLIDGSIQYESDIHIHFLNSKASVDPIEIGVFHPKMFATRGLACGEVGYIATGLKDVRMAKVGDTITISKKDEDVPEVVSLPGYKEPKSMVFVGLFPIVSNEFQQARIAMEKLQLSDSAFTFRPISSMALGNGFHCGFLGLLHAEIVQERIQREFGLSLLATSPSVEYLLALKSGTSLSKLGFTASSVVVDESKALGTTVVSIQSATEYPDPTVIDSVKEPIMQVAVYCPKRFVGAVMQLSQEKRGEYVDLVYHGEQAEFTYLIPLSEMIVDFFDRLKSVTEGYASLDYEFYEYRIVEVSKVDILVNRERVDALAFLIVKDQARKRGKEIVERLVER
ncbi:MAG: GTP-binding protein LepA, GTP-binding protein LepA [Microgenomates group bacterium GW2011_GWC1_39_12]|nr:MAG: GTP-binding protein LepA, GTP-binding protein LepA [Microgenomates group bacterium GW2011_GWC1_39_12]